MIDASDLTVFSSRSMRFVALVVTVGTLASCATSDAAPTTTATATAAATAATTSTTTSTTTPIETTPIEITTSSTTTPATTTTQVPASVADPLAVMSIGVFGDSLVADLTAIGGRDNQVVPLLADVLESETDLVVDRVANFGVAGQSVLSDLGMLPAERATIRLYVESFLQQSPTAIDLAVVAVSSSDINVNASLPEPAPIEAVAEKMLTELLAVEAAFRAAGVDVVFVPVFGISDTVFLNLRCALATSCPDGPDAEVDIVNDILWKSDLAMLFERFDQLDLDRDGRTDRAWFDNVDPRYPDDGVHPNASGQDLYSQVVAAALRRVLLPTES